LDQEVKTISISNLVLWTENPRDPIDENATDQDIADRALDDSQSKWTLSKLAKEMGGYYDFSELPTVVYHNKKPVVYDGNRRIILGKIKHGLIKVPGSSDIQLPDFPDKIPCNVCKKKIALNNVYRKHADTGSWLPLERDIFLYKFMGKEKSLFLILDEETGIICANPHLNQRFVKDEIFKEDALKRMGFHIKDGNLYSVHNNEDGRLILSDISRKIEKRDITTRKNRGKVIEVLDPASQKLIALNKEKNLRKTHIEFKEPKDITKKKRQSRRTPRNSFELFGGKLYLNIGEVSDLYRDIADLYRFYIDGKSRLSKTFPSLIKMALRLLCESAAKDRRMKFDNYVKNNFDEAKKHLDQDEKTTLANQNISKSSIMQLLHTGAHSYQSSSNIEQTIALSIIIGQIITITHGKDE